MDERRRPVKLVLAALAALAAVAVFAAAWGGCGGEEEAEAQTVRFQKPTESGPDPFTPPADRHGRKRVEVGSGPFGGTGSDLVCDRELLIRSLRARPERMREWARVVGVEPTQSAVARYIRRLRPVTLTRDTRVTNHSFVDGRAVGYQAILQAGTAVLVDKDGVPVARCRCGNPLAEPAPIETAKCFGCPADYRPPPPCEYYDYDDADYTDFDDGDYERTYDASRYDDTCYRPNFSAPAVVTATKRRRASPQPEPEPEPAATTPAPEPEPALNCDAPRSQAEFEQCHPPQEEPSEPQQPAGPECDVPHFRANQCADIEDKSTDPGIQP